MEEFKQLEIYLFPIVMLLAIGMNNWKREERTQGDRIFGFLPFLIICMMGSDVTYHALQLYVHRFTVLYAGYLVYCFFLTAVPYAWLLYVNGKLSVRHNRRWTAAVCHVMTGTAIAVVLLTVIIPWRLSTEGWGVHAVSYSLNHGSLPAKLVSIAMYLMGLILTATVYPKEVTKEGQKETRYLLEAGVFSLVGGMVQSFAESWRTGGPFVALAVLFIYLNAQNRQITTDGLTGLNNRREFDAHLQRKIELCPEHEWGLLMIDVDDFKLCNDTYGHLTGDMALAAVAGVIWRCIRREDTLVRYGGDEFVLVLPEIKEDGLVEKLQEIQEKIQNAVIPGYSNIQLSVSMGAVISQNESVEHAMLRADKLMYQAKNKKNMAITENNMIDHEGKIHAQKQPEKMIPEILVVDDEEVNRTLLDMIFSKDYHVLQAESGEKCIEILEQQVNSISLVLLDVVLPKMDGFDVLTYMNKNHWIEDIPVIMMSGADAPEAVKRAYALGAVDFVSKPCDAQIVYQRVTNTMKLYAKQRRLTSLITAQINEKEKNSEMLIHILSHIVEFRNGESGSHVLHIHKLTEMLLERLAQKTEKYHLDGDTRAMIALASSLHDIGKIGVDEKILNKPGKLTKEEFEIMKTHTVIGAEMLEQLGIYQDEPLVKIAHQICRWHHERYDGKGYPDGLVGDEIPISAQVVSVADVYDALASERVYKKAVPHEKVLEMILHGECGQFNPILIECLQEISSRIRSECYDEEQET